MARKFKKALAILLALSMCSSLLTVNVFAQEGAPEIAPDSAPTAAPETTPETPETTPEPTVPTAATVEITITESAPVVTPGTDANGNKTETTETETTWEDTDQTDGIEVDGQETSLETKVSDTNDKPLSENGEIEGQETIVDTSTAPAENPAEIPEPPAPEYDLQGEETFTFERQYDDVGNAEVGDQITKENVQLQLNKEGYKTALQEAYNVKEDAVTMTQNNDGTTTFTVKQETVVDTNTNTTGGYNVPEKPEVNTSTTDENGNTTTVLSVEEKTDENGNVIGHTVKTQTTDANGKVIWNETKTTTGTQVVTTTETLITTSDIIVNSEEARNLIVTLGVVKGENQELNMTTPQFEEEISGENGYDADKRILVTVGDKSLLMTESELYQFVGGRVYSEYGINTLVVDEDGDVQNCTLNNLFQLVKLGPDGTEQTMQAYCTDLNTRTATGTIYDMTNLDVANYFTAEASAKLHSIVENGYWGNAAGEDENNPAAGSLTAIKAMMKDALSGKENGEYKVTLETYYNSSEEVTVTAEDIESLMNPAIAISGTQAAIWTYGNRENDNPINVQDGVLLYMGRNLDPDSASAWKATGDKQQALAQLLYECLVNQAEAAAQAGTQPHTTETLITKDAITSAQVVVRDDGDNKLEADVSFTMTLIPDAKTGDLLVHVREVDENGVLGEVLATKRLAGENKEGETYETLTAENNTFTIQDITLSSGQKITLQINGTQNLDENGVYLFTANSTRQTQTIKNEDGTTTTQYLTDENGNPLYDKAGQDTRQTLIGRASGSMNVDLCIDLSVEVAQSTGKPTRNSSSVTVKNTETNTEWDCSWEKVYVYETDTPGPGPTPDPTPDPEPKPDPQPEPEPEVEIPEEPTPLAPEPEEPEIEIPEEEVPLADLPEEEVPLADLPEEEVPLADLPDEEVPLADVPKTGDETNVWYTMFLMAGLTLGAVYFLEKRGKEKEEA